MLDELFDNVFILMDYLEENDSAVLRESLLTTDKFRYWYCARVRDRKEVWSKITSVYWGLRYWTNICKREELRKGILVRLQLPSEEDT